VITLTVQYITKKYYRKALSARSSWLMGHWGLCVVKFHAIM